ncbi:hypothetical protein EHS39_32530 [Ensifer sp. MPMI2T]|nr:hypothetical protein EHS39_32530 [Ensifer sp. MPMI2T]
MTVRFRLSETDCISINGIDHQVQRQDENGVVLRRLDDYSMHLSFTHVELARLLASPDMRLKRNYFSTGQAALRTRCDIRYINSLPLEKRAAIFWKTAYCHAFLETEARGEVRRTEASMAEAMPELSRRVDGEETAWQLATKRNLSGLKVTHRLPPSAPTLRLWLRMFEKCGHSPLAFLRKKRADLTYSQKFSGEAAALLAECVAGYLSRNMPTQQMIVNDTKSCFIDRNRGRAALNLPPLAALLQCRQHVPSAAQLQNSILSRWSRSEKASPLQNSSFRCIPADLLQILSLNASRWTSGKSTFRLSLAIQVHLIRSPPNCAPDSKLGVDDALFPYGLQLLHLPRMQSGLWNS